jgi:riboflavin kinase / FMN adenylyltransferase
MKIIQHPRELAAASRSACVALGVFDGIHLGHRKIISQTLEDARKQARISVVVTFDRHPGMVLAPAHAPKMIYPTSKKMRVLAELGVVATVVLPFDRDFSRQSGEAFILELARELGGLASVSVGSNFVFGYRRSGDVRLLQRLGEANRFIVHGLPQVQWENQPVSSTRIRNAIALGQFADAEQMLGRPYSLCATVIEGDRIGRQWGFPTANLDAAHLALPPHGVYAVHASFRGQAHPAVLNLGLRPTLNQPLPRLQVEAHLLDFSGDLYGIELEIIFVARLRDEMRFPTREALQAQIRQDIAAARKCL